MWAGASGIPFPFHSLDTEAQRGRGPPGPPSGRDRALSWSPLCLPRQTVKRPRKIRLPAPKASPRAPGRQDSDEEDGPWRLEEADHGRGYEGDTSSGSGRSSGERSHRPRAGRRSRASSRGRRSPGGGSEANGLALVSGFKRLPRQDVRMRPVKSVLVRRRESEGEPDGSGARRPAAGPPQTPGCPAPRGVWAAGEWPCPHPRTCGHVTSCSKGDTADRLKPGPLRGGDPGFPRGPVSSQGAEGQRLSQAALPAAVRREGPRARDGASGSWKRPETALPGAFRTPVVTQCLIRLSCQSVTGREPSPTPSSGTAAPMVGGPRAGEKAELQGDPAAQTPGPASVSLLSPQSLGSN